MTAPRYGLLPPVGQWGEPVGRRFTFEESARVPACTVDARTRSARTAPLAVFAVATHALAIAAILLSAPPCGADDQIQPEPLTGIVDTLEVVSDRPEPLEAVPTFATVHDVASELDRVSTVTDVIEKGAGVHVRRYGGLGAYSAASIRASSPGQVEVYVDGVPVNSVAYGMTNLADLPLDGLERIEVYRGGTPVEFGTAGVGGAINLVTSSPGSGRAAAALSAGSHGTFRFDILRSGGLGLRAGACAATGAAGSNREAMLDYALSFHHLQSEGDFEYLDRHGTPENEEDDEIVTRENNDFRQSDLLARFDAGPLAGWRLEASNEMFWKRSGVPGIENVHIKSVHYRIFRNTARVSIEPPRAAGGAVSFRVSGFNVTRRDRFYNPDDEVGFDRSDSDDRSWNYGANLLSGFDWHAARQSVSLFAEFRRERFVPESSNPAIGIGFTRKRATTSLSGEDRLYLLSGNLELVAGYRYQSAADNYAGPVPVGGPAEPLAEVHRAEFHGPSFGARARLRPGVTLKVNRTRYSRFPSMVELFGSSGFVEGNTELSPESGTTTDVGIVLRSERSSSGGALLEAVLFWAERDDLIVFLQNSQRTVKAFNLESARVEGIELTARRSWKAGLSLSASYTFQDATNEGPSPTYNGKTLPYEPRHDLFLRTEWRGGAGSVWHEYHYQGEAYRDQANLEENRSPASRVHNVGARIGLAPGSVTLSLEVRNLTDERIVDVEGYPLPGRTFYATLTIESS